MEPAEDDIPLHFSSWSIRKDSSWKGSEIVILARSNVRSGFGHFSRIGILDPVAMRKGLNSDKKRSFTAKGLCSHTVPLVNVTLDIPEILRRAAILRASRRSILLSPPDHLTPK